jgi:hypothetical protein
MGDPADLSAGFLPPAEGSRAAPEPGARERRSGSGVRIYRLCPHCVNQFTKKPKLSIAL